MDYTPNQVLRLVQFGLRQEVLTCKTIWICVGCHTCSSQCPMSIDIAAVMDTLRLMAVEEGVAVGKPNIVDFHEEVLRSLEKYGRAHKLGIMLGYKRQTGRWLKDLDVGLKMLAKRKLDLIPSRVRDVRKRSPTYSPVTGENRHERRSATGLFLFSGLLPGHHRRGEQPFPDAGGPDLGP